MNIKVSFVIFTIVWALLMEYVFMRPAKSLEERERLRNIYSQTMCFIIFLIAAFRPFDISLDTREYVSEFLIGDFGSVSSLDNSGFIYLLSTIRHFFGGSPRWLLVITSAFFPLALYSFMKRIKTDCMGLAIFILLMMMLGFFDFILSGMKQTIAIAFILWSYKYLEDNNFVKFLLCVVLASLFHSTALIALIIYPLRKFNLGFVQLITIGVMLFLSSYASGVVTWVVENSFLSDQYENYIADYESSVSNSMLIIFGLLTGLVLISWKKIKENKQNVVWFNVAVWAIGFQLYAESFGEFFRLALYFSLPLAALAVYALDALPKQFANPGRILFVMLVSYYVLWLQDGYFSNYII